MVAKLDGKKMLKVSEASKFLGVHPDTLRRWERLGKITAYRHPINRYRLFREQDVAAIFKGLYRV